MASIIHQRLSAWPAMLWRWSGNGAVCDPFHTLSLAHAHSGPWVAVDLPVNHYPHPSLSPPWTASSRSLDGWHKNPENYWHQVQVGSCILHVRILWLAFKGHVTYMWQIFWPYMCRPCDLHEGSYNWYSHVVSKLNLLAHSWQGEGGVVTSIMWKMLFN